jgi:hypothetical protein
MPRTNWLLKTSPAFRLMIATSWLAPDSWQKNQEEAILEAIGAGPDWTEYLRLVKRHRTPALSCAALSRVPGLEVPQPAKQELQERSDACRMEAVKHCLLLAEVLKGFNRTGIPAMPFKGQILSFELYGDAGLRQARDLDLAVAREDLARAQVCLENMGWQLDSSTWFPLSSRQWESFLQHEHHLDFVHSRAGRMLELHWRNQWETQGLASARWARSISSVWQGCSIVAMDSSELTFYLCSHGGDHAWFRAKWLGDLARAHALGQLDWEAALGEARKTGQERVLLVGLRLLDEVYGFSPPVLTGNPSVDLPSLLIETPLSALMEAQEPESRTIPVEIRNRLRMSRFEKLSRPRKRWRESLSQLIYCREDFRTLCLPDSLFWAYIPLRPILWAWRLAASLVPESLGTRAPRA